MPLPLGLSTRSIHAGEAPDPATGAHGVPIYQNATYAFRSYDQLAAWRADAAPHFYYARDGNPTVRCLELKLADLEGAEAAVATASGMAAISATLLHLLGERNHLVASCDLYQATQDFLCRDLPSHGAAVTTADFTDPAAVAAAITPETGVLFAETFSNPGLRVVDLDAIGQIARQHGIPFVVDNTFLSPALLRPLEHGADLVVHSATKYLAGHGQVLGGVVCGPREMLTGVGRTLSRLGGALSAMSAWLLLLGIKTLPLRMERHSANAARLAALLAEHPAVAAVHYPGLATDPGHDVARRLAGDRYGGMLAFRLQGGEPATRAFINRLDICTLAVSLGEYSTLVWPYPDNGLMRVSVGLEDIRDLESEFAAALDGVMGHG